MATKLALVVDDSRVARLTLNKILLGHSLRVVEQDSAESALKWLQQQSELPDIIFMDLMMPGMDGITATRAIKANAHWQTIPVVVCTGNDSELDKSKAADNGAVAVLAKPPAADVVTQILSQLPQQSIPTSAPEQPQPQLAARDEEALLSKLQQQLEQQWLPQLRAELSAQLNQQKQQANEQSSQQQAAQMEAMKLSLLPDLKQQMQDSIDSALSELHQRAASDNTGLQQQAISMLEQAFQGFDVLGQWQSHLQEQAGDWLSKQKLQAQDLLQQNLNPLIDDKIQQQLSTELSKALNNELETALTRQNAALTSQLKAHRAELETAHKRNITLAWAAIGIALAALIISVL
ncbi:MAG: response regulator [Methylophaga sp.]|nr:response regulator [Methylophaga sp.]